jgi:hypothetical protein
MDVGGDGMIHLTPLQLIGIGFLLVLAGAVLPFLMVMRILESTFFLNFFSYAASVAGLMLGLIGTALYTSRRRRE